MVVKKLLGNRIMIKRLSEEYSFTDNEKLLLPNSFDLNKGYSEGIAEQVSESSMCCVGDRIVYLEDKATEVGELFLINDDSVAMFERDSVG